VLPSGDIPAHWGRRFLHILTGMTDAERTTVVVDVPTRRISDWASFHDVFASALGFADYGRNNNAFADILSAPQAPDVAADVPEGGLLLLRLDESVESFADRCPEQFQFLVAVTATLSDEALRLGEPGFIGNAFVGLATSSVG
jgi:hypothetical protein